jgi:hypothetical protein
MNLSIAPDEFPPELRDTATSLFDSTAGGRESSRRCLAKRRPGGLSGAREAGTKSHRPKGGGGHSARRPPTVLAANALNRHLDRWVFADSAEVLAAWRARDALCGREVAWEDGSGVADGIDDRGHLAVALRDGGRVLLGAGDVHLRL